MTFSSILNQPYVSRATLAQMIEYAGGYINCGTTGGISTAYTATAPSFITSYENWQLFGIRLNATCGVSPTLNINSIGAKNIVDGANVQMKANQLGSGRFFLLAYDDNFDAFVTLNNFMSMTVVAATITGTGYTQGTTFYSKYAINAGRCRYSLSVGGTISSGSDNVVVTLPVTAATSTRGNCVVTFDDAGTKRPAQYGVFTSTTQLTVYNTVGTFTNGTLNTFVDVEYEVA